jgi:hypothetical protein
MTIALAAAACSHTSETTTATKPCSPLADPRVHIVDEGVTPDGHYVVTIGSGDLNSRIFFGTPDHMAEARLSSLDTGCFVEYHFVVDGRSLSATFGNTFAYPCSSGPLSRLTGDGLDIAGETLTPVRGSASTPADAGAPSTPLTFFCF